MKEAQTTNTFHKSEELEKLNAVISAVPLAPAPAFSLGSLELRLLKQLKHRSSVARLRTRVHTCTDMLDTE